MCILIRVEFVFFVYNECLLCRVVFLYRVYLINVYGMSE